MNTQKRLVTLKELVFPLTIKEGGIYYYLFEIDGTLTIKEIVITHIRSNIAFYKYTDNLIMLEQSFHLNSVMIHFLEPKEYTNFSYDDNDYELETSYKKTIITNKYSNKNLIKIILKDCDKPIDKCDMVYLTFDLEQEKTKPYLDEYIYERLANRYFFTAFKNYHSDIKEKGINWMLEQTRLRNKITLKLDVKKYTEKLDIEHKNMRNETFYEINKYDYLLYEIIKIV